jgi:hypothetical protein
MNQRPLFASASANEFATEPDRPAAAPPMLFMPNESLLAGDAAASLVELGIGITAPQLGQRACLPAC